MQRDTQEISALIDNLPRSSLHKVRRQVEDRLYVDVIGLLPDEVALLSLQFLSCDDLLNCRLVSRRWCVLADDSTLWKRLCATKGWQWKDPSLPRHACTPDAVYPDTDDEGMGDEEEEEGMIIDPISFGNSGNASPIDTSNLNDRFDNLSSLLTVPGSSSCSRTPLSNTYPVSGSPLNSARHHPAAPNWKLLYMTHALLYRRFQTGSYHLSHLQSRGAPRSHTSTIYCLQLYTYPETGLQVLFTGSRDRTIREWDLSNGRVLRVIDVVHAGSVLSLCARDGLLASAGSDGRTVLYDLNSGKAKAVMQDHEDSVLCVRLNGQFLASCSKDRSIRVYRMPNLTLHLVLSGHRAAVNTIQLSHSHVISASGDKSVRIWNVQTGAEEKVLENHHCRGIAAIDAEYPVLVTGSSDKHIRLFDLETEQGWSTSAEYDSQASVPVSAPSLNGDASSLEAILLCQNCGSSAGQPCNGVRREECAHKELVRTVAMNTDFVVSGSYDHRIKIWCRKTGRQVADLTGGHTGRVFCIDFDHTKIVSAGEDKQICIWSFAHGGLDTSFMLL
ncbi:quinon protein alcohol dehydrogenase-like superfamily [Vararia minispora EC-137]|uniref:Quinon protein alcohol dehydrogenase-like superfamily n=1 Tax=Vararia minispora EC-137 TaxID=1314806 RepID=A0ACB8QMT9_9AGAM|nr:quinon protein alcohol dehydrogenase-like superfamily [Vararia minispora EC-137]